MNAQTRVELEPAYILHSRAYRETSQILDIFTPEFGRIGIVANGARRPKSAFRGYLNSFHPLRVSWSGRGELVRLVAIESFGTVPQLTGERVMAGFYVNELLLKLLHRGDAHPNLFAYYSELISDLSNATNIEELLRRFEMVMLSEIGYAMDLQTDCIAHEPLQSDSYYEFQIERGLVPVPSMKTSALVNTGAEFTAIAKLDFSRAETRHSAKQLLRSVLNFHLGGRPLRTRAVAAAMKR